MTASRASFKALTDAAVATISREIAAIRRAAEQERAIRDAEHKAAIAALLVERVALESVRRELADKMKSIRPGKDADPELMRAMIAEAVAAIPAPKDGQPGKSITVDDVMPMIEAKLCELVDALLPAVKGEPGPMGALPIVKEWQDRVYYQGEVVTFDGALWQAHRDTGKAPGSADWVCIVAKGRDGVDGRSFRHVGTYSPEAEYSALDVVNLNGGAFAAKRDNPGECPGEGWALIAAQGKPGKPGLKGDKGDTGLRGLPAKNVLAVTIDDGGLLKLVNADGSTVECDLYPVLSKVK